MARKLLALFLVLILLPAVALGAGLAAKKTTEYYKDEDVDAAYDAAGATMVDLSLQQNGYTIDTAGTWVLTGSMEGQLTIRADEDDLVRVVLAGASIHNPDGPAIYGIEADKVVLTLADGAQNSVSDGVDYPEDAEGANAAIYMKTDLSINGSGALTVAGQTAHAIRSNDTLVIASGSLTVTAVKDGLRGKDAVVIVSGSIHITAGSDGIVSNNEDAGKGWVYVEGGSITIQAARDGIQAQSDLTMMGGAFDITTGEGASAAQAIQGDAAATATAQGGVRPGQGFPQGGFQGTPPQGGFGQTVPEGNMWPEEAAEYDGESAKGLKAGLALTISGGTFNLNTADDAIHSNGDVTIRGGAFTIFSGDDGMHADGNLRIDNGEITVSGSVEGLEGKTVTITGGTINIAASDDGINASSGTAQGNANMFGGRMEAQAGVLVSITGGNVTVTGGYDAIDSNGDITISGGTVNLTSLRSGGGNRAIDPSGTYTHTGGTVTTNDGSESGTAMPGRPNRRP